MVHAGACNTPRNAEKMEVQIGKRPSLGRRAGGARGGGGKRDKKDDGKRDGRARARRAGRLAGREGVNPCGRALEDSQTLSAERRDGGTMFAVKERAISSIQRRRCARSRNSRRRISVSAIFRRSEAGRIATFRDFRRFSAFPGAVSSPFNGYIYIYIGETRERETSVFRSCRDLLPTSRSQSGRARRRRR